MEFVEVPNASREAKSEPTFIAKLGNVMSVQPERFDKDNFTPEKPLEYTDEQGRTQIKGCDIENYIRWRRSETGSMESNARLVRWEDGSYTMFIGSEPFEVNLTDQPSTYTSLRYQDMYFLHNQIQSKLIFKPCSIKNRIHIRKLENTLNPVKTTRVTHSLRNDNSQLQEQENKKIAQKVRRELDEKFLEESSDSDD